MEIRINHKGYNEFISKFQEGGAMAAPTDDPNAAPAPEAAPQGGEDPQQQLMAACQQALDSQDCQLAMQVCAAIIQMMGGGAPEAPAASEGQQPVFKKGGKLSKWVSK